MRADPSGDHHIGFRTTPRLVQDWLGAKISVYQTVGVRRCSLRTDVSYHRDHLLSAKRTAVCGVVVGSIRTTRSCSQIGRCQKFEVHASAGGAHESVLIVLCPPFPSFLRALQHAPSDFRYCC